MKKILLTSLCMLMAASIALANLVVPPTNVPGKEYSNDVDEDSVGNADPHQVIWWDGAGSAADTFDYTGAGAYLSDSQVDALANHWDALFYEVINDEVTMLTSFTGFGSIYYTAPVHYAPVHATLPNIGIWAAPANINAGSLPDDVDGLEVWGPTGPGGDDADRFSLAGDPFTVQGFGRVSVWDYDSVTHTATPFITAAALAGAIGRPDLEQDIDLDAMMTYGNTIMFSIAPIARFDGGEIWVWTVGGGPASYLVHGGCTWDTGHSVMDHFGVATENINALEAVPEPATVVMLGIGGLVLFRRRRV